MACDTSTWWPFLHTLTNLRLHNFRLPKASPQTIFFFFFKFLPCSYDFPAYQCRSWLPHVTRDLQACNSPPLPSFPLHPTLPSSWSSDYIYIYIYKRGIQCSPWLFTVTWDPTTSDIRTHKIIEEEEGRRRRATRACLLQGVLIVLSGNILNGGLWSDPLHCKSSCAARVVCGCVFSARVCVCVFFFTCLLLFIVDYNQSAKLQLSKAFISFHKLAAAAAPNFFFFFFFLLLCTSLLTSSHL